MADGMLSTPTLGVVEQLERQQRQQLAQRALQKQRDGKRPTGKELRALRQFEQDRIDQYGPVYCEAVPKKVYCDWSGRQTKVLHGQADRYGAPLRGRTINLPRLVRWLHEFLAENAKVLSIVLDEDDPLNDDPEWRSKCYEMRYRLMQVDYAERRGDLVPREYVHELLGRWAVVLSGLGARLSKLFGEDAVKLLNETLDDCAAIADDLPQLAPHDAPDDNADNT